MGRTRALTDLYVLFFLTLILASPFFLYIYHRIEIGRLLVLRSDIEESVWTLQCFTIFRFGVQFCHFFHFFKSDKVSIFFSEIGPGLILHFLGLCTLINPFFARSDVSH